MESDKRYWVGLNMIPGITPKRFHVLLSNFPDLKSAWNASKERIESLPGFDEDAAEKLIGWRRGGALDNEMEEIGKANLNIITLGDERYPEPLRPLEFPPPVLYEKGEYLAQDGLALAVVGTRKCSEYGRQMAERLATQLTQAGFTIISGMAKGIDSCAHHAALAAGGRTVAIMGTGLNNIYPEENVKLAADIEQNGAVLSEFRLDQNPTRWSFPRRNRIISGLCRGTLVVEAPAKSGALITARCALQQGREVFAVPGDARRETLRGNHGLIKDGAKLVEEIDDVVEEFKDLQAALPLDEEDEKSEKELKNELNSDELKVYSNLDYEPIHFNEIVEETGFPPARLSHIIFKLQMDKLVKKIEGNRWVKLV